MKRFLVLILAAGLLTGMTIASATGAGASGPGDATAAKKKKCGKGKKRAKKGPKKGKCVKKKGDSGPKTEYQGRTSQGLPITLQIGKGFVGGSFDLRLQCYTNTGNGVQGPTNAIGKAKLNGAANTTGSGEFNASFKVSVGDSVGNGKIRGDATKTKATGSLFNEFTYSPTPGAGQVVCGTVRPDVTFSISKS